jgi:hypothetical protein
MTGADTEGCLHSGSVGGRNAWALVSIETRTVVSARHLVHKDKDLEVQGAGCG